MDADTQADVGLREARMLRVARARQTCVQIPALSVTSYMSDQMTLCAPVSSRVKGGQR